MRFTQKAAAGGSAGGCKRCGSHAEPVNPATLVFLALDPIDGRKSSSLTTLVKERLGQEPTSRFLFAFVNKAEVEAVEIAYQLSAGCSTQTAARAFWAIPRRIPRYFWTSETAPKLLNIENMGLTIPVFLTTVS